MINFSHELAITNITICFNNKNGWISKRKSTIRGKGEARRMKIRPCNDNVLIFRVEEEQKTAGGIIIPDTAKKKSQEGKVIAVGSGKIGADGKRVPLDVKAGDRVLFSKYAGTEIKIDGVEHVFMKESDILAIFE
jgi:chaperonin GroES